jgi:uncharacterized RDD family membrane protein YckC
MRCPKCQYISFDSNERCRNCGYEFAFTPDVPELDLPIQTGEEALGPLDDFPIGDEGFWGPSGAGARRKRPGQDAVDPLPSRAELRAPAEERPAAPPRPITSVFDLPLFKDRPTDDDRPLVEPSAVPRQPLSVRRSSPPPSRAPRVTSDDSALNLDALEPDVAPLHHLPWLPKTELRPRPRTALAAETRVAVTAGVGSRLSAAIVDGVILVSVCSIVVYITLEVCGLRFDQARVLPIPPMAGFLLLLIGGYFVLLTAASGQTIGKMALGIRVVPMDSFDRVSLGHSTMRAAGYLVSVLPVGLGLLPALVYADRRTLHDRLADTRVVKA